MTGSIGSSIVLTRTKHGSLVKYNLVISGFLILFIYFPVICYHIRPFKPFNNYLMHIQEKANCGNPTFYGFMSFQLNYIIAVCALRRSFSCFCFCFKPCCDLQAD